MRGWLGGHLANPPQCHCSSPHVWRRCHNRAEGAATQGPSVRESLLCACKSANANRSPQKVMNGKRRYYVSTFLDRLMIQITI